MPVDVRNLVDSMSLEQKVGQVFIFTLRNLRQALNDLQLHPGGFVRIYSDALTVAKQNFALQSATRIPLWLAADFEQGIAPTVSGGIHAIPAMGLGATHDSAHTFAVAKAIAEEASALGVNLNFMPVLDVNTDPRNPVINVRSFGENPRAVAQHGIAFMRGLHAGGLVACAKHFPGHGATHVDSHSGLPVIDSTVERLRNVELFPFREAIAAGLPMIMTGHLSVPALDKNGMAATLSPTILQDVLRCELGFKGVIISDALDMGAVANHMSEEDVVVHAFNAGCDILLMPREPRRATQALLDAVKSGRVKESRLDEAVTRIISLKAASGLFENPYARLDLPSVAAQLDKDVHRNVVRAAAMAAITLVSHSGSLLPLSTTTSLGILIVSNEDPNPRQTFFEPRTFADHCAAFSPNVRVVDCTEFGRTPEASDRIRHRIEQLACQSDVLILCAYVRVRIGSGSVDLPQHYEPLLDTFRLSRCAKCVVSFGHPYLFRAFRAVDACICAYGNSDLIQECIARQIFGHGQLSGRLPVSID